MGVGKCVQPRDKDVGDRPLCTSLVSKLFAKIDSLGTRLSLDRLESFLLQNLRAVERSTKHD